MLGRGGLNTPHDHPAWVWSGTYYVSVPEGGNELSRSLGFLDSRTNARTLTVEGASCFASKFIIEPNAGMLLMFPSYLRHWVYPNDSDTDRVTVAFNAQFVRSTKRSVFAKKGAGVTRFSHHGRRAGDEGVLRSPSPPPCNLHESPPSPCTLSLRRRGKNLIPGA